MNFSKALSELKMGAKMTRKGWNGKGMWIALQIPTPDFKMNAPYLYMCTSDGKFVPWLASQTDLMAEDWDIASPNGGVNCDCDMAKKCDNPVGDKILHDILENGWKCHYIRNTKDEAEDEIASFIKEKIEKDYGAKTFVISVTIK